MKNVNNQNKGPTNPSRREFLQKAAKGGSIAALIASGAIDLELKNLLLAQETKKVLSKEALEGPLPSRDLDSIRKILKGEYYRGGRLFVNDLKNSMFRIPGLCDPVVGGECKGIFLGASGGCKARYCNGEWSCPKYGGCSGDCPSDGCDPNYCDDQTCVDLEDCPRNGCSDQTCGGVADGCPKHFNLNKYVDTRKIDPFNLSDIRKYSSSAFVQELLQIMNLQSPLQLEAEVKQMINRRQTLQMRGYVK